MITSELISYIRKQIKNNISRDLIISKLTQAGWHREDIDEGFLGIDLEPKTEIYVPEIKKEIGFVSPVINIQGQNDHYREPLSLDNLSEGKNESAPIEFYNTEDQKPETPKADVLKVDNLTTETLKSDNLIAEVSKKEEPKVWTPMNTKIIQVVPSELLDINIKSEPTKSISVNQVSEQKKEIILEQPKTPEITIAVPVIIDYKSSNKNEELIPSLIPKVVVNSFGSINKDNLIKTDSPNIAIDSNKNSFIKNLPQSAMLSSYEKDLLFINQTNERLIEKKGTKVLKWLIVIIIILAVAGITFVFASDYLNISNLNIPFIKKDPRVLLLNNSKVLSSLQSYKSETNIEISSPSFANISSGLISGEAVTSSDVDTFSINTLGTINKNEKGLLSDNFVTIKSSILQDYITTDIKNDGTDLYISVPDLSQIIKEKIPLSSIVKINQNQFNLIPSLFSFNTESSLKKINLYKILSSGMPSYINNETLSFYDEFINKVEIIEKGQENIKGIDTYHYSINPDKQLSKKLLSKISENFVLNLSSEDKDRVSEILGAVIVDSFEVWVGKGDNNIYQYNVILDIPLSKIVGLEDKSIGDNKINIVWKTTYYDFNIKNNIFMPEKYTQVEDFVNTIKESKIKKDVVAFKQLASSLSNAEGVFGSKPNSSGSCMSPTPGSLFSPLGHNKGAITAVSNISELLNKVMGTTYNAGYCYSTSKAWSFTIPISNNYDQFSPKSEEYKSFFCVDSIGTTLDLSAPSTGVICK